MLKKRIIPKLLLKDGRNVKGVRFGQLRDTGHPVTNARVYDAQGADELLFLDIAATPQGRGMLGDIIARTAEEVFMPFTVGGGVRSVEDVRALLLAGADKVAINTAAVEDPRLVRRAAERFGAQCIVVSIDYAHRGGIPEVLTHGGTRPTGLDARTHAARAAREGAGELLLTSVDRDGTREGFDLQVTRAVAEAVDVPVIASGGAGTLAHLAEALGPAGGASAVAVGSLFHFTDQSPIKARSYLKVAGLEVRA